LRTWRVDRRIIRRPRTRCGGISGLRSWRRIPQRRPRLGRRLQRPTEPHDSSLERREQASRFLCRRRERMMGCLPPTDAGRSSAKAAQGHRLARAVKLQRLEPGHRRVRKGQPRGLSTGRHERDRRHHRRPCPETRHPRKPATTTHPAANEPTRHCATTLTPATRTTFSPRIEVPRRRASRMQRDPSQTATELVGALRREPGFATDAPCTKSSI
jgi:hypothetical protein